MSNILDIVKGINQAANNAYDGAITEEGEPLDIGLQRNKPTPITDRRVMDGFGVTFNGTTMRVNYHREVPTNEVMTNKLKTEIESSIEEVYSFLKKEYNSPQVIPIGNVTAPTTIKAVPAFFNLTEYSA